MNALKIVRSVLWSFSSISFGAAIGARSTSKDGEAFLLVTVVIMVFCNLIGRAIELRLEDGNG